MIYQYIYISYSQTVNSLYILNSTGHRRKLIMLDFRVSTFLTVCEYMNYTKAAEALHITQPAVTRAYTLSGKAVPHKAVPARRKEASSLPGR